MKKTFFFTGLVLALGTGCGDATSPTIDVDDLVVTTIGTRLVLHNQTDRPVHFVLASTDDFRQLLQLVCAGPTCPSIRPDARDTVLMSSAISQPGDPNLYLHWWHAFAAPNGGFRPDSVRTGQVL